MAGSSYGNIFKITTWGESHGKGLGVVIDGCPAGIPLTKEDIQPYMDRRKPGQSEFSTQRSESDQIQILSGTFQGVTTGTPISIMVLNADHRTEDYGNLSECYRPGHADFTYDMKYGIRDYRGGGRSSGRETLARVAAGAVAQKILGYIGVKVCAYTKSIGSVEIKKIDLNEAKHNALCMPDADAAEKASKLLKDKMSEKDSCGGIIECVIDNLPIGVGDPVFEKLDANLAKAVMSIGAVKGVEIGDGFKSAESFGSENNDGFESDGAYIYKSTNHAGGILGGISDGSRVILRAAVKPTPSIARPQATVNKSGENINLEIKGRHDPVIVPRAVVVVEAMTAVTVVDMLFSSMTDRIDKIREFFN